MATTPITSPSSSSSSGRLLPSHSRNNSNVGQLGIVHHSHTRTHSSSLSEIKTPFANGLVTPTNSNSNNSNGNDDTLGDAERQLLIAHTVPELHAIEQKKRQQAEDKKEELRQLVGLRYRVLVQSADSIESMETLTKDLCKNLSSILGILHELETKGTDSWRRPTESDDTRRVRALQGYHRRVRQFAHMAELIWVDVSHHRYMAACDNYMTACDMYPTLLSHHTQLFPANNHDDHHDDHDTTAIGTPSVKIVAPSTSTDKKENKDITPSILLTFINQHYETIRSMPSLLIRQCQLRLLRPGLSVSEYSDALVTLALLSHHNHIQSLSLFLRSRTAWLTRSISAAQRAFDQCRNGDSERTLCHLLSSVALTFQCTISHASYLFAPSQSPQSSTSIVSKSAPPPSASAPATSSPTSSLSVAELFNSYHQRRYAVRAASGTPSTTSTAIRLDSITSSQLRSECDTWYRSCITLVREPLTTMLTRITMGSQLSAIRDAVLATLVNYPSVESPSSPSTTSDEKTVAVLPTPPSSTRSLQSPPPASEEKGDEKVIDDNSPENQQRRAHEALLVRERLRDRWQSQSVTILGRSVHIWDDVFALPFSTRTRDVIRLAFERLALHTLLTHAVQRIHTQSAAAPTTAAHSVNGAAPAGAISLANGSTPSPLATARPLALSSSVESIDNKDAAAAATTSTSAASTSNLSFVLWPSINDDTQPFALLPPPSIRTIDTPNPNATSKGKSTRPTPTDIPAAPTSHYGALFGLHSDHVDTICEQFNSQLSGVMADVGLLLESSYITTSTPSAAMTLATASLSSPSRLPLTSDPLATRAGGDFPSLYNNIERELRPYSRRMNVDAVERVNRALNSRLDTIQEQVLDMMNPNDALPLVDEALFIGRVCSRLASPPPSAPSSTTKSPSPSPRHVTPGTTATATASTAASSDPQGAASAAFMYRTLQKTAHNAFRIWTRFVASTIADEQRRALAAWILQWATDDSLTVAWPKPDSADAVPVPTECSPYASRLIFSFLHELNRVNGHHVPSRVLSWSLHDLATQLLRLLEDKLDVTPLGSDDSMAHTTKLDRLLDDIPTVNHERKLGGAKAVTSKAPTSLRALSQAACLQLLFDLKFVFAVLRLPDSVGRTPAKTAAPLSGDDELGPFITGTATDLRGRLDNVLAAVESGVDMIDYAASRDQLHSRLSSLLARTATLYGPLVRSNPFPTMHSNCIGAMNATTPSSSSRTGVSTTTPAPSVAMEVANILPLAAVTARIPALPASLYPTKASHVSSPTTQHVTSSSSTDDFPAATTTLSSFDSGPFATTVPTSSPAASTVTHSRSQSLAAGISGAWSSLLPPALPVRTTTRPTATGATDKASSTPTVSSFLGKLGLRV